MRRAINVAMLNTYTKIYKLKYENAKSGGGKMEETHSWKRFDAVLLTMSLFGSYIHGSNFY
jgi:hypothetical protein